MSKYSYKGVNLDNLLSSASNDPININAPNTTYNTFRSFNRTTSAFAKIDNPLNYKINGQDIASAYNIEALGVSFATAGKGTIPVPAGCDAIKVYLYSVIGDKGATGVVGTKGAPGPGGAGRGGGGAARGTGCLGCLQ